MIRASFKWLAGIGGDEMSHTSWLAMRAGKNVLDARLTERPEASRTT